MKEMIKELDRQINELVNNNAPDKVVGRLELKRQELIKSLNNTSTIENEKEIEKPAADSLLEIDKQLVEKTGNASELIQKRIEIVAQQKNEPKPNKIIKEKLEELDKKYISPNDKDFIKRMRYIGNNLKGYRTTKCINCGEKYWEQAGAPKERFCSVECEYKNNEEPSEHECENCREQLDETAMIYVNQRGLFCSPECVQSVE